MITTVIILLVVAGALNALAALVGPEMRKDARDRDRVARLFRDPFRRDDR